MDITLTAGRPAKRDRSFRLDPKGQTTGTPEAFAKQFWLNNNALAEWQRTPKTLFFRSKVHTTSALCAYLLIHGLTRVDHDMDNLKSRDFTDFLNKEYPQIVWDPVSVGKMLSDLVDVTQIAHSHPQFSNQDIFIPMTRNRNGSGYFYQLFQQPVTVAWFHALLAQLRPMAEHERDNPGELRGSGKFGSGRSVQTGISIAAGQVVARLMEKGITSWADLLDAYPKYTHNMSKVGYKS